MILDTINILPYPNTNTVIYITAVWTGAIKTMFMELRDVLKTGARISYLHTTTFHHYN